MKTGKLITNYDTGSDEGEWIDMLLEVNHILVANPGGLWHAEVKNFGWRKLNGCKDFEAHTAQRFMSAILPDCRCSGSIYRYGRKGFAINNMHHDSPLGDEWYYVVPRRSNAKLPR